MSKLRKKKRHFFCELFRQNFHYCAELTNSELINYIKLVTKVDYNGDISHNDGTTICVNSDGLIHIFIWVRFIDNYPVLAHESNHAALFCLSKRGVCDEEATSYLIEWIMKRCLN